MSSIMRWRLDFWGCFFSLGFLTPQVSLQVAYTMSPYVESLFSRVLFPMRALSFATIVLSSSSHRSLALAGGKLNFSRLASRACTSSSSSVRAWMSVALWFLSWPWSSDVLSARAERCCSLGIEFMHPFLVLWIRIPRIVEKLLPQTHECSMSVSVSKLIVRFRPDKGSAFPVVIKGLPMGSSFSPPYGCALGAFLFVDLEALFDHQGAANPLATGLSQRPQSFPVSPVFPGVLRPIPGSQWFYPCVSGKKLRKKSLATGGPQRRNPLKQVFRPLSPNTLGGRATTGA